MSEEKKYGFHVNPETLQPGQCRARVQDCGFGVENHYASMVDAIAASEEMIAQREQRLKLLKNKPLDVDVPREVEEQVSKPYEDHVNSDEDKNALALAKLREESRARQQAKAASKSKKHRFGLFG
jgi:uncharacterized protein YlaI